MCREQTPGSVQQAPLTFRFGLHRSRSRTIQLRPLAELPRCAGTAMPLRRNGDAVAPERLCRCAGTATPSRRNRRGCGKNAAVSPRSLPLGFAKPPLMCGVPSTAAEPLEVALYNKAYEGTDPLRRGERHGNMPGVRAILGSARGKFEILGRLRGF